MSAASLALLVLVVASGGREEIGVLPLTSLGLSDEVVRPIEDVLRDELRKLAGERLVFSPSHADDDTPTAAVCGGELECLFEFARASGWRRLIIGNLAGLGQDRVVNLKLYEVSSGERLRRVMVPAVGNAGELVRHMRKAAVQLVAPERYVGSVRLRVPQHGVHIAIDGESAGTSPLDRVVEVPVGRHAIEASGEGWAPLATVIEVGYEDVTPVDIQLAASGVFAASATPFRQRWWPWLMAGIGAAAVGAGSYFNVRHVQTGREIDDLVAAGRHDHTAAPLHDEQSQQWTAAAALYGSGGALLFGTGVLFAIDLL